MTSPLRRWFREIWPRSGPRQAVLSDYATVGGLPHFLTDVALRGGVFTAQPRTESLFEAGRREGRRQLALEIIRIAGEDPSSLWNHVEKAGNSNA